MESTSKTRLLLVDDSADILKSIKIGLERRDFVADTFTNPLEALAKFEPGKYDLALLDVNMPVMDGFELCKELLKKEPKLKVCFFSAYENYKERLFKEFPEIRSDCFLSKPMTIEQLAFQINEFIDVSAIQNVGPSEPEKSSVPPTIRDIVFDQRKLTTDW